MTQTLAPDHQRISFTAKLVALGRSASAIPFARDVSELVGAPQLGEELAQAAGAATATSPIMAPMVEARYQSLVSAIRRSGVTQVLEFASGVSLRGLAMTLANPNLTYIETDLSDLTAEKRRVTEQVLSRHQLTAPRGYHVAVANILDWDEVAAALVHLTPSEPVAIVHEGLMMYLSHAEKAIATGHIARILDRFGGVWFTPDFTPVASMRWFDQDADPAFARSLQVIEERTGRSFATHSFASEDEALSFCKTWGFHAQVQPQLDGSFELTTMPPADAAALLPKLSEHLKLWEMRRHSQA